MKKSLKRKRKRRRQKHIYFSENKPFYPAPIPKEEPVKPVVLPDVPPEITTRPANQLKKNSNKLIILIAIIILAVVVILLTI
jgi:hypothetical protein